ncbi:MAG: hypothetical protein JNJ59_20100, partial [Deltaproteobacteria bacterium]|nr:hypothetical protein [Deltaproteobacteria bacterium]
MDTSGDVDGDGTPGDPTIDFWFLGATGELGRDADKVTFVAADEPAAYVGIPGFQIDLDVETASIEAGQEVRLFVDETLTARANVTIEDGVGHVKFSTVTIPARGRPVGVHVEATVDGTTVSADKDVELDVGPCVIEATLSEDALGCVDTGDEAIVPLPAAAARVQVTLTAGSCDRVSGTATIGEEVIALDEVAFAEDGTAELTVPLGTGLLEGELSVEVTALHPSDDSRNGTATVTGRLDQVPADASWVTPADALLVLSRSVDSDGDDTNGIQYQVQVTVDVAVDEAVTATLYRGDSQVGEVQATGPGTIDFGVIDFADDGVVALRAEVVDGCGNTAVLDRDVQVVTGSGVAITSPVDGAVLLQRDDGDAATLTIYETTFSVFVDGATAGDTIEVLCQPALPVDPEVWIAVGSLSLTEELVAAGDTFEVAIAADIENVGQASRCIARVPGDASDRTSKASAVTFAIPGPRIVVDNPIEGQCFTSSSIGFAGIANGLDGRNLSLSGTVPGPDDGPIAIETFATVATGAAAGDWSGTYTAGDLDGDYAFTLTGTDVLGNETSSSVSVSVDRLPPELALEAPGVAIDGAVDADQDLATPGYQTTVRVSVAEARGGGQVCLTTNGGEPACQDLADSVVWTGVTLVLGQNQLVVTGRDGCGNDAGTVSRVVTLVLDNPIAITSPAAGARLLAKNDGDKTTARIYETSFGVNAVRAVVGSKLAIECRPSAGGAFTIVGTTTVATVAVDGDYTVAGAVDTASLGTSVSCRATIDLPNAGTSPELALTFALPLPTLEITAPAIGACLTADFAIGGAATGLDGRAVTASLVAPGGATVLSGSGNVTVGAWSVPVALGATVDGNYTVIADATDAFGNAVSDGVPPAVAVRVDRTLPTLARLAPGAEITDADDVSPSAGVQVDVSVQLQDQSAAGGEACLSVGSVSVGCRPVVSAATPVIFEGVTFQPGDNEVVLTGRDACGNAAGAVSATVTLLVDTPTVVITTPAADLLTTATTLAFAVTVTEPDATPLPGVTVALLANGIDTGVVAIDVGDGTYTFANVPLAAGVATTFTARATRPGATGTSGPRIVTQKNVQPTIAVTQPANGTVFNRASAACQVGVDDCVLAVTATTTQAEDGSAAVLEVSCGAVGASYNGTVAGGTVSFAGVLLGNNQSCTLTPRVTDAVAQTVTGSVVTVSVDRISPTVVITAPLVALQSNNDADPVATGVQAALTARLGGVPAGAIATATLSWTDAGGPQTKVVTHTVATATADGGSYTAAFEEVAGTGLVTWPEGLVTVVVSVGDTAGNTGSATQLVTVDTASSVRITSPASAQDVCGAGCAVGTVCNGGECWRAWGINSSRQVIALVSGLQTTSNNVRVCSDHPSLAATGAALCASAPSATGSYYQVLLGSSVSGSTILDIGAVLPEGYQRVVVEALPIAGGGWITSQSATAATERQRRLFVDLRAPVVASVTSPSDTLAPVGTLNAAEQFAVPRVFQVAFSVDEASSAQVFVNGTAVSTQSVAVGSTTVSVTLPEGTPQVWVVLTDSVGNRSPLSPGLGAVTYQPTVDVTLPTLTFVRPS